MRLIKEISERKTLVRSKDQMMSNSSASSERLFVKRGHIKSDGSGYHYLCGISSEDLSENSDNIYFPSFNCWSYSGSCGGLLYMDDMEGQTVICNPATKEMKFLPPSDVELPPGTNDTDYKSAGFGFDSKSDDYKVIRFLLHYYCNETMYGSFENITWRIQMYSLRSDSWKEIEGPDVSICSSGVYVDGNCYWIAATAPLTLLAYNFATDTFSPLIPLPPAPETEKEKEKDNYRHWWHRLVEYKGLVGIIRYEREGLDKCFEVWVLKEPTGLGVWEKVFDVVGVDGATGAVGFGNDGRLLFLEGVMENGDETRSHQLLVYDCGNGEVKKLDIYETSGFMEVLSYVEDATVRLPAANQIQTRRI